MCNYPLFQTSAMRVNGAWHFFLMLHYVCSPRERGTKRVNKNYLAAKQRAIYYSWSQPYPLPWLLPSRHPILAKYKHVKRTIFLRLPFSDVGFLYLERCPCWYSCSGPLALKSTQTASRPSQREGETEKERGPTSAKKNTTIFVF